MGYFSELAIELEENYVDYSYPSPEIQAQWRIEDLRARFDEINRPGLHKGTCPQDCIFACNDLVYVPPECFSKSSDIMAAIQMIEEKYALCEASIDNDDSLSIEEDEEDAEQLDILESISHELK